MVGGRHDVSRHSGHDAVSARLQYPSGQTAPGDGRSGDGDERLIELIVRSSSPLRFWVCLVFPRLAVAKIAVR